MDDLLKFPVGSSTGIFKAIAGQRNLIVHEAGRHYEIKSDELYGNSRLYAVGDGWEMIVNQYYSENGLIIEETHDASELLLVRFVDGGFEYAFEKDSDSPRITIRGVTMLRTDRSIKAKLLPKRWVRWVGFRITREVWNQIMLESWPELTQFLYEQSNWVIQEPISLAMEDIMSEIFEWQERPEGRVGYSYSRGFELITLFLMAILRRQEKEETLAPLTMDLEVLLRIKDDLLQNLSAPPSTQDLVKKYGVSEVKLRTNFKNAFGMPPHQFVTRERLRNAHRLVCRSDFTMSEIAYSLGFSNTGHFSSAFKKEFGHSPSEARHKLNPD